MKLAIYNRVWSATSIVRRYLRLHTSLPPGITFNGCFYKRVFIGDDVAPATLPKVGLAVRWLQSQHYWEEQTSQGTIRADGHPPCGFVSVRPAIDLLALHRTFPLAIFTEEANRGLSGRTEGFLGVHRYGHNSGCRLREQVAASSLAWQIKWIAAEKLLFNLPIHRSGGSQAGDASV